MPDMEGYVKSVMVEQIYLRVTGGAPGEDESVKRVDIYPFLNAAIRSAYLKRYFELLNVARATRDLSSGIDEGMLVTYEGIVEKHPTRDLHTLALPVAPLRLPSRTAYAIGMVGPKNGFYSYVKIRGQQWISGLPGHTGYWWLEDDTVFLWNVSKGEELLVRMIPDPAALPDDGVVYLPPGGDIDVLDLAQKWFTGQDLMPTDPLINDYDETSNRS